MRIPNRIVEHPLEALIAGALLIGLLFGSSDAGSSQNSTAQIQFAAKL